MSLTIREMGPDAHALWADLAHALWPEAPAAEHLAEIAAMTAAGERRGWLAREAGAVVGFAELGVRPYANGATTRPVAFLEAIWVAPAARRRGIGRALLAHLEGVARREGLAEIGSDVLIGNSEGQAAHRAWGFAETERVVCYVKRLG